MADGHGHSLVCNSFISHLTSEAGEVLTGHCSDPMVPGSTMFRECGDSHGLQAATIIGKSPRTRQNWVPSWPRVLRPTGEGTSHQTRPVFCRQGNWQGAAVLALQWARIPRTDN